MAHRDIVVIGASAGGLQALKQILSAMPRDVEAALLVVLHTADHSSSMLPHILERRSNMPVSHPRDGDPILRGRVYIAPPGFHMIVEKASYECCRGRAKICTARPSILCFVPRLPPMAAG